MFPSNTHSDHNAGCATYLSVLLYDTNLLALVFSDLLAIRHNCSHFFYLWSMTTSFIPLAKSFELLIFLI